jgi:uncharacterized protein DUF1839
VRERLLDLNPTTYVRHVVHADGRVWPETNCYADVWIELLHALGRDPVGALPFTVAIDFEGDQWTFFKVPPEILSDLYGIDVQELAIWRPLAQHLEEQVRRGRPCLAEVDSFYLPDTAGTAYRRSHVKTTVAVTAIDLQEHRLGYFHNAGYYELRGDDFDDAVRVRPLAGSTTLPPYVEFAKIGPPGPTGEALRARSRDWLRRELTRVPRENPFIAFHARLAHDAPALVRANDLEAFHAYSFATFRQFGAGYELAATYLEWLERDRYPGAKELAQPFHDLAVAAKLLQFQLARAVARGKPLDLAPVERMAEHWQRGIAALTACCR